jgi:hypothetical protein
MVDGSSILDHVPEPNVIKQEMETLARRQNALRILLRISRLRHQDDSEQVDREAREVPHAE